MPLRHSSNFRSNPIGSFAKFDTWKKSDVASFFTQLDGIEETTAKRKRMCIIHTRTPKSILAFEIKCDGCRPGLIGCFFFGVLAGWFGGEGVELRDTEIVSS
jgi:hypothetical protein